ncbi:hypothetical protein [Helicobacter ganmani]|uniref:hypothetical protein n=1 Tax=Helicobacter ganmani TaxID=60246 RepID=UPI003A8A2967
MKKNNGKIRVTVPLDYSVYDKLILAYSDFLMQNNYISFIAFIAKKISEVVAE